MSELIEELNYYTHAVGSVSRSHFHYGYELIYVACGNAVIEINGIPHTVSAPAVILLNPFEQHKIITADRDYFRYMLVLDSARLEREIGIDLIAMIKCRPANFRHVIPLDRDSNFYVNRIFSLLKKESENDNLYKEKLISNEIDNLLIFLYRNNPRPVKAADNRMAAVQKYIDEDFAVIENVNEIARRFYISGGHLSRSFKEYSGYTPVEYLTNTRLYNAQLLLLHTDLHINSVCEKVGYRDINNFIRRFKEKFGLSPRSFRAQNGTR